MPWTWWTNDTFTLPCSLKLIEARKMLDEFMRSPAKPWVKGKPGRRKKNPDA